MNIQLVPRVCRSLTDQSFCPSAIAACGADTDPDLCTLKLVGKALISPDANFKVIPTLLRFSSDTYNVVMHYGHQYLHGVADSVTWWWVNDCCKAAIIGG